MSYHRIRRTKRQETALQAGALLRPTRQENLAVSDTELWRMVKATKEARCSVREIHGPSVLCGWCALQDSNLRPPGS